MKELIKDIELLPLPKTWEEYCLNNKIKENEFYIQNSKEAEVYCALMKLHQLRDCYRQGWIPDWHNQKTIKVCIVQRFAGRYTIEPRDDFYPAFLSFKDNKTAKEFLKNFRDLIKQAGDLI